jgi:hypothetical protein
MPKLEPRNPDFARELLSVAGSMPIVKFLGVRALALDPGEVRLEIPYRDEPPSCRALSRRDRSAR